jgi:hypothetical protein
MLRIHLALLVLVLNVIHVQALLFFQKPTVKRNPLIPDLETLIEESKNGVEKTREDDVKLLMIAISESRQGDQRESLPGQWELVYTTEKEINFFKTSWPFAKVSSITQDLDLYESGVVDNFINFEGGGQFAVTGKVMPADGDSEYDRVAFEFTSAVVSGWGKKLSLPPTGAGWFDTMFCEEEYRLSTDCRGDWSVFRRIS